VEERKRAPRDLAPGPESDAETERAKNAFGEVQRVLESEFQGTVVPDDIEPVDEGAADRLHERLARATSGGSSGTGCSATGMTGSRARRSGKTPSSRAWPDTEAWGMVSGGRTSGARCWPKS